MTFVGGILSISSFLASHFPLVGPHDFSPIHFFILSFLHFSLFVGWLFLLFMIVIYLPMMYIRNVALI